MAHSERSAFMAELSMRVEALLVGIPAPFRGDEKSGIVKLPVTGPVQIGALGLEGDGQADLIYHGGPDQAVHLYVQDPYPFWREITGRPELDRRIGGADRRVSG